MDSIKHQLSSVGKSTPYTAVEIQDSWKQCV